MSVASFSSSAAAAAGGGAGGGAGAGTSTRTGVQGGAGDGPRKFSSESAELAHAVAGHKTESRVLSQYLHDTATTESNRWPIIKYVTRHLLYKAACVYVLTRAHVMDGALLADVCACGTMKD